MNYAEVIVPVALEGYFTYFIPDDLSEKIRPGIRVEVGFGKRKHYSGIVRRVITEQYWPDAKPILDVLDENPIITPKQLALWDWISDYYMCTPGEVMNAALPNAFRLASESKITMIEPCSYLEMELSQDEFMILEALDLRKELSIADISMILQRKKILGLIRSMEQKGLVKIREQLEDQDETVRIKWVRIDPEISKNTDALNKSLLDIQKSIHQTRILLTYLSEKKDHGWIKSNDLTRISGSDGAALKVLIKKGILVELQLEKFRLPENSKELEKLDLSNAQQDALQQMEHAFHLKNTILLKGVTGSGKTQVYMELIRSALAEGKQVLYMVPEIALTSQLVQRIRRYFPDQTQEYHSGLSNKDRMAVWTSCLEGYHPLFIGARSSVFLPFRNLGLIIVDEEHDPSYKQNDPAPRYNARDTAILLGNEYNAKIILGSATPSVESYHQALSDRIGLVRLDQRYGESQLPDIQVISLKEAKRKGELKGNFSEKLLAEMNTELDNKRQIIVFRNRRGYSPILQCTSCKWESHCTQCAINLTYHKYQHALKCHICGLTQPLPLKCPECGKEDLKLVGFGTEKLEEELRELFPDHEINRFDQESARTRARQIQIMESFQNQEFEILVGTQMLSKGLDFDNVGLVVIIQADQILHFPDFRANERAFQLMTQVSGRSGRRELKGKVIIQAYQADHPVIKDVIAHEYTGFAERELKERERFHYPPFVKLIRIEMRHSKLTDLERISELFCIRLRKELGQRVLGPAEPSVSRIKGYYAREAFIKIERNLKKINDTKVYLKKMANEIKKETGATLRIIMDVDPY
jgi:primosomal protein N' (replication factor Y)